MPYDPTSSADTHRLREDIQRSRQTLGPFIETRRKILERFVGDFYGTKYGSVPDTANGGSDNTPTPVNLLSRAASIYMMLLGGSTPQVLITPRNPNQKPFALDAEAVINQKIREIRFGETLQDVVMDALFCVGCIKVGVDHGGAVFDRDDPDEEDDFDLEPFAEIVSAEDLVLDMTAQRFDRMGYMGNFYHVPEDFFREAAEEGFYNRQMADRVSRVTDLTYNEEGAEKAFSLLGQQINPEETYRPFVELIDVFLPDEQVVVTLAGGRDFLEAPLRVVEWEGPHSGPYHFLDFFKVPGMPIPTSIMGELIPLHDGVNRLIHKTVKQALRQKSVTGYRSGAQEQAQRIRDADDGAILEMEDPTAVAQFRFGGPDNQIMNAALYLENQFDRQGGNLSTLGGLRAQAETIGQEQMLSASASKRVSFMREEVVKFVEKIVRHLGWHWWNDTEAPFETTRNLPGTKTEIPVIITRANRDGMQLLKDFSISVDPHSLAYRGPEERLAQVMNVANLAMQALPIMVQQGVTIDFQKLFQLISRYTNMPEIADIMGVTVPQPEITGGRNGATQAPTTNRVRTERRETPEPQDEIMRTIQQAAGGGNNGQQEQTTFGAS